MESIDVDCGILGVTVASANLCSRLLCLSSFVLVLQGSA